MESIIQRYSSFVPFPIELNTKRLNTVQAIWARNKNEIKEEEYNEFYTFVGHDHDQPLFRLHFTADAPLAIQALLFVPSRNFETLGMGRIDSEVNLYCRKILIQAKAKGLFPEWLRFLKGVVDSEDLPLNISRETMQDTTLMQKLNKVLTGRFLKFLDEQSEKEAAAFEKFYHEYQRFLKEGIVTDFTHKEALGKLLRYESSSLDKGKLTSLADYVKRMSSEQKDIYCLLAANREAAESSPYFEVFKERKFEVLFLYDAWDEFVMEHLHTFDGKPLKLAEKAELNLSAKKENALSEEASKSLAQVAQGNARRQSRRSPRLAAPRGKSRGCGGRGQIHDRQHAAHDESHEAGRPRTAARQTGSRNQSRASDHGAARRDALEGRRPRRQRGRTNPRQRPRRRRPAGRSARDAHALELAARKSADEGIKVPGQHRHA